MYNTSPYSLSRSFRYKPCRAVIYGRASTEHEAQVKALQNQMQWYDDVARFHPQWNVINRYIDQGITGTQVYTVSPIPITIWSKRESSVTRASLSM